MLGVRNEDKNEWERRVPLTPQHVAQLVGTEKLEFAIEPSGHRVFRDSEYRDAGARITADLSPCSLVLGIKEIPADRLRTEQAYLFFSHTTKGQAHNMPLLKRLLDLNCTLLDYELITDDHGRRLIFFGRHAGYAGMIDGLWALGQRYLHEGYTTPFAGIQPAHRYDSLAAAQKQIAAIGEQLSQQGLPEGLPPTVCGVTGTGNVSVGAQEIIDLLPTVELTPQQLEQHAKDGQLSNRAVYKVIFDIDTRYRRLDGGAVTLDGLIQEPHAFANGMLPWMQHLVVLVNGMFWVPALPRLLSLQDAGTLWSDGQLRQLKVIADISCDIDGAVEATVKATTPDDPVFVYDLERGEPRDGFEGAGPVVLAVDNLPAELPRESSSDFGDTLLPFVAPLARCDWSRPLEQLGLPPELSRAVITHQGQLTPAFSHLAKVLP